METILTSLLHGFDVALSVNNILWVTLGGIMGTLIGMLPGIGPATGVAVLLPMTFALGPVASLIMMCGIYYGAMFGGSRSSILINTPGDGAALAATFDGYPMSRSGRAEAALAMSAVASFIGGIIATVFLTLLAMPVSRFALRFGPAEYLMLMVFALSMTASMAKGNQLKGFISMLIGLLVATIGLDAQSGVTRFTFGVLELQTGVDFLVVIIGIYALGEVYKNFRSIREGRISIQKKFGRIWFSKEDWKRSRMPILRSAPLGFFVGALPGAGGTMASLMAYNNERNLSNHSDEFGKGAVEGLAAPESANNAASVGALIPMLTLGIPGSGTTAVMMGALLMLGIQPGPLLFTQHPDVAWGVIASMFIGNVVLALINVPLAGLLVRILSVPGRVLYPVILGLAYIGTYSLNNSVVDFYLLVVFGLLGLYMSKAKIPTAPMILAVIVGGTMETSFRQALMISDYNYGIFFKSAVSLTLLALTIISILFPIVKDQLKKRKEVTIEQ